MIAVDLRQTIKVYEDLEIKAYYAGHVSAISFSKRSKLSSSGVSSLTGLVRGQHVPGVGQFDDFAIHI